MGKIFFIISTILLILYSEINAQINILKENVSNNIYTIDFSITPPSYKIINNGSYEEVVFDKYKDEQQQGSFVIPFKDIFLPLPLGSKAKVILSIKKRIEIDALPEINDKISIIGDSLIKYEKLKNPINFYQSSNLQVKGYLYIGGNYCIHLRIKLLDYDISPKRTFLNEEFSLELIFNKNISIPPHIQNTNIDRNLITKNIFSDKFKIKPSYNLPYDDSWIDYTKNYVKLGTARDGVYRIYPQDLIDLGVDVNSIDAKTFRIINKGNEIPIYVNGEMDNTFLSKGYIEFVGIRNMGGHHREVSNYGQPYNEYLGRYTDTSVYWLTWGGSNGLRVKLYSNSSNQLLDTLKYYNEIYHYEVNNWYDFSMQDPVRREYPYWYENKTWIENLLGVGDNPKSFSASNIFPNKPAYVFAKLQDYASDVFQNAHLLSLSVNSDPRTYDSIYINKYQQVVLNGTISSNLLQEGNNSLIIHSYPTLNSINSCAFDWIEVEYPRYLYSYSDSLNFKFPFLTDSVDRAVDISNISSDSIIVWKYGNEYKKYFVEPKNGQIIFDDTISNSDKFVLISQSKIYKPQIYYLKKFINLDDSQNQADYILITNKIFNGIAQNYDNFIEQQYKVATKLVDVDDIYDQFSYGYFNPEAIKYFLESTHMYWKEPYPKYVFLAGSATYDYYGNKTKNFGAAVTHNYVPSFGAPVSDTWFVIWDTTGANIPQMDIGRLPATSVEEFQHYFDKHKAYVSQKFDDWNKRYLFFSGGNFTDPTQLSQLKSVNDFIIDSLVIPAPIGGEYTHFYKTNNPVSNFGPYSDDQINNAIKEGAIFISYLGHSGTQTWDNSITDPVQLNNDVGRFPLITDYGCSTGKFAEPDIVSFSQLFVNGLNGQAIAYIGNSSLGFLSTAITFPQIFYKVMLQDSVYNIGEAHRKAKIELLSEYGSGGVYGLFAFSNTLIGDPIISLPIPPKPNLNITTNDIHFSPVLPTDNVDSLQVKIIYRNLGKVFPSNFIIKITDEIGGVVDYQKVINKILPTFIDSLTIYIPIKNKAGEHILSVVLDTNNVVDEITKDDNKAIVKYVVASGSLKSLVSYNNEYETNGILKILNPIYYSNTNQIDYQLSLDENFLNPFNYTISMDSLLTQISLNKSFANKRIWFRSKLNYPNSNYGNTQSIFWGNENGYLLNDSLTFSNCQLNNLIYSNNLIKFSSDSVLFQVVSAGFNDGNTAIISENGKDYIPESTLRGHHVCVFDAKTLKFIKYYNFDIFGLGASAVNAYISLLDTLNSNYIVAFAISDEGSGNLITILKNEIKSFGSKYIDSIQFRNSWAMIGRKGSPVGSVPEMFTRTYSGRAQVDTTMIRDFLNAALTTTTVGPASKWNDLKLNSSIPNNSKITVQPIGITNNGEIDTLQTYTMTQDSLDLRFIDANKYNKLKFSLGLYSDTSGAQPTLSSIKVNYSLPAELGLNYQTVSISKDTVYQGDSTKLFFTIFNVGEAEADSFKVDVYLNKSDKTQKLLFDTIVVKLDTMSKVSFELGYKSNFYDGYGPLSFSIQVDNEQKIPEIYKDNNYFNKSFYVVKDTITLVKTASISYTFDGNYIYDGDYVSPNPEILFKLNYGFQYPYWDTTKVNIILDGNRINYAGMDSIVYDTINRQVLYKIHPKLKDGEHYLTINGNELVNQSNDLQKTFIVSNQLKVLNLYNYPNPFNSSTYFTFNLTQIPEELKIKIYSVAGRLLREINVPVSELRNNFNRIYWDGRDEDGDLLANGVYLYKIIAKLSDQTSTDFQKLAIVR